MNQGPQSNYHSIRVHQGELTKLYGQLRVSSLLAMDADEFLAFVRQIEENPIFKTLMFPVDERCTKVLTYRRFPDTRFADDYYRSMEQLAETRDGWDIEQACGEEVRKIVRAIGRDAFIKYFLYNDFDMSIPDLARRCGVDQEAIGTIVRMLDTLWVGRRFTAPRPGGIGLCYRRVASIYKEKHKLVVGFFDIPMARGMYVIDHDRLNKLKAQGFFTDRALGEVDLLIRKLELVNVRSNALFLAVGALVRHQKRFLTTGEASHLEPRTQRECARLLGISTSVLSRALKNRSIGTPWGHDLPMKFFFPGIKGVRLEALRLLQEGPGGAGQSDEFLRVALQKRGIYVSRRTVANYRKELSAKGRIG